jgi:D-alanyl-D-alanine carboxypeptidase/D-alanyl-D-alanine-endopeptidase (penicillin-binding protein 4)
VAGRGGATRERSHKHRTLIGTLAVLLAAIVAVTAVFLVRIGDATDDDSAPALSNVKSTAGPPPPLPAPVLAKDSTTAPVPTGLATRLSAALGDSRLGGEIAASVVDVSTGRTLLDQSAAHPATPASTNKILTGIALLAATPANFRFTTKVVAGARPGEVVLVGGGDPTLSAGSTPVYPGAARIADLAREIRTRHVTRIVVDDSRYAGTAIGPGWDSDDVSGGYVAPITALMTDAGLVHRGHTTRSNQPDIAAGQALARALGVHATVVRGTAPRGAKTLAAVRSAPITTILEQTLTPSDNTLAECLGREVAVRTGEPGSFAGAAAGVRKTLARLGIPVTGLQLADSSGLSRNDRISPATLTAALRVAAGKPALQPLFGGMPVGGYAGTLADRYHAADSRSGAGYVRAKTGTLSGVSSLAGVVQDRDGRLLAFALMADRVTSTLPAEDALDAIAAKLASL